MTETSLRPRPSYATTADESASQYASAHSYLRDTTGDEDGDRSMWTAPSYHFDERPSANASGALDGDSRIEVLSTPPRRPPFVSNPSSVSTTSCTSSSSGSEVDMSGPLTSPFFVPPPPSHRDLRNKENLRASRLDAGVPRRPTSPLPPLPASASGLAPVPPPKSASRHKHLRGPSNATQATSNAPYRAPPLTDHNSLAAFQAAHVSLAPGASANATTTTTGSDDSHRTSSDVDLDLSFDYDPTRAYSNESSARGGRASTSTARSSSEGEGAGQSGDGTGQGSLERLEDAVMRGGWVGIEMRHHHGIPEGQLVRSGSGKLVGARASRARSALDLRAQFKAAQEEGGEEEEARVDDVRARRAQHGEQDVSIVVMEDLGIMLDGEDNRRREVRAGKRPTEGERAGWINDVEYLDQKELPDPKARRRRSAGVGFAYNATGSLYPPRTLPCPPHSAPLRSEPVFASLQQEQRERRPAHQVVDLSPFSAELDQAKRTKAFPLPLRLIDRSKGETTSVTKTMNSPSPVLGSTFGGKGSRHSLVYYDSDVASPEPSPLFDQHTDDEGQSGRGTNRTAPSTPNDTPLFQECFSDEETTPPAVPDREGALAGLGFDFDISDTSTREEFPVVPLRRRSLPPVAATPTTSKRLSNRHMPIPSLSISPPPRTTANEHALEDILETDSSRSSQDSAHDPTVSPSRRISRRLSSSNPGLAGIGAAGGGAGGEAARNRGQSFTKHTTSTPTNDRGGATIITPQHLLVTPGSTSTSSPDRDPGRPKLSTSPSFSFSPAPLRLVKAQLLRAAGYRYDHVPTSSPPLGSGNLGGDPAAAGGSSPPSVSSLPEIHHATSSPRKKPATPQPQRRETDTPTRTTTTTTTTTTPSAVVAAGGARTNGTRAGAGARLRKRTRVGTTLDELSDLLSSSAETWIDEVIPAKLAFIAGFLLGPWCWIIGGWYLRPQDGELPRSRGQRCRAPTCNCGRILRGSTTRQQAQHTTTRTTTTTRRGGRPGVNDDDDDEWAGLDKWVFGNRVAACGGGVGIAVLVGVAIWAAASA